MSLSTAEEVPVESPNVGRLGCIECSRNINLVQTITVLLPGELAERCIPEPLLNYRVTMNAFHSFVCARELHVATVC